ncbi:VOC family protein [Dictyobacter aurantiacus]|nr:VOC family protein [Dictyobacter aurantiacus]
MNTMQMKLELIIVPVSDVDRARTFYTEMIGFAPSFQEEDQIDRWSRRYQVID